MGDGLKGVARRLGGITVTANGMTVVYDKDGEVVQPCARGGTCKWKIDGQHSNRYCEKCFADHPHEARRSPY